MASVVGSGWGQPAGRASRSLPRRHPLLAATFSAIVPGAGQWYAGRRRRAALLFAPALLTGVVAVLAANRGIDLLEWLVRPEVLWLVIGVDLALLALRLFATADAYRLARSQVSRPVIRVVLAVLLAAVALPHVVVAQYGLAAVDVIETVFDEAPLPPVEARAAELLAAGVPDRELGPVLLEPSPDRPRTPAPPTTLLQDGPAWAVTPLDESAGAPPVTVVDPAGDAWLARMLRVGAGRVNVLLAGGDAGPGRGGLRTDTMMVASLDPGTGRAVLFGLPRNLARVPLPREFGNAFRDLELRFAWLEAEKLAAAARAAGDPPEGAETPVAEMYYEQPKPCRCYVDQLNALYTRTKNWVRTFPDAVDPGMEALRRTVANLLGLEIDYYVLVDMAGFVDVVDALGGIDVYVHEPMHIAFSPATEGGEKALIDVPAGPAHLDGLETLAYVRSRWGTSDYVRMGRQRCVLASVANAADPLTLLVSLRGILDAVEHSTTTNIPRDRLPGLIRAAAKLDLDDISFVAFTPPAYTKGLDFLNHPIVNVSKIRATVRDVLASDPTEGEAGDSAAAACGPED